MGSIHGKKVRPKISCYCPFKARFCFQRNRRFSKYFWLILKLSCAEEKGLEISGTGRRLRRVVELQKSNFEALQPQFRNHSSTTIVPQLFLVRHSAIALVVRNIAELRRCGLKLRMPNFAFQSVFLSLGWFFKINQKVLDCLVGRKPNICFKTLSLAKKRLVVEKKV